MLGLLEGLSLCPAHPHADEHEAPAVAVPLLDPLEGIPGAQVLLEGHPECHVGVVQVRVERGEDDLRALLLLRLDLVVPGLRRRVGEDAQGEVIRGDAIDDLGILLALHREREEASGQCHSLRRVGVVAHVHRLDALDRDEGRCHRPELPVEAADQGVCRGQEHRQGDVVPAVPCRLDGLRVLHCQWGLDVGRLGGRGLLGRRGTVEDAPGHQDGLADACDVDLHVERLELLDLVAEGLGLILVPALGEHGREV